MIPSTSVSHNMNVVLTRYLAHSQGKTPNSEIQIIMKLRSFTIIFIQVLKKMCINSSVYRYKKSQSKNMLALKHAPGTPAHLGTGEPWELLYGEELSCFFGVGLRVSEVFVRRSSVKEKSGNLKRTTRRSLFLCRKHILLNGAIFAGELRINGKH